MQVFVYEYFTGGGASELPQEPAASLLAEAAAMVRAVAADFVAIPSVRVVTTRDDRLAPLHPAGCEVIVINRRENVLETMGRLAGESDWTLLIAPETGRALLTQAEWIEQAGGRLLSPGRDFIEIAANKQTTIEALHRAGVPAPRGGVWPGDDLPDWDFPFPVVVKPVDSCGSQQVQLISSGDELKTVSKGRWRVEEFIGGLAVSVSVLCGPHQNWPLVACEQRLSQDGHFSYLGGRLPLAADLDRRARGLAMRAIEALPRTLGYVGVDLVLGDAADGSGDRVIEVNPRLTTSYVGLRAASRSNLAAAMLAAACGDEPHLSFRSEPIEFTSAGKILS